MCRSLVFRFCGQQTGIKAGPGLNSSNPHLSCLQSNTFVGHWAGHGVDSGPGWPVESYRLRQSQHVHCRAQLYGYREEVPRSRVRN